MWEHFNTHWKSLLKCCHIVQHWLVGFYNRDGVCLLRGTDWVFQYNCLQHPFHPRAALISRHFCYQFNVLHLHFFFVLFLSEGQAGEAWESFNVVMLHSPPPHHQIEVFKFSVLDSRLRPVRRKVFVSLYLRRDGLGTWRVWVRRGGRIGSWWGNRTERDHWGKPRRRWVDNIRMDLQEVGCGYVDWIGLA